jgi:hypothetical protein
MPSLDMHNTVLLSVPESVLVCALVASLQIGRPETKALSIDLGNPKHGNKLGVACLFRHRPKVKIPTPASGEFLNGKPLAGLRPAGATAGCRTPDPPPYSGGSPAGPGRKKRHSDNKAC